jgi:hypothetical protein
MKSKMTALSLKNENSGTPWIPNYLSIYYVD